MKNRKIARRYARVLFELAGDRGEEIHQRLRAFARLLAESRELRELLLSPAFRAEERRKVMAQILKQLNWGPPLDRFFGILVNNRRLHLLDDIAGVFLDMIDRQAGRVRVRVESAKTLAPELQRALEAALSGMAGGRVVLEARLAPELLAGLKLEIGQLTIDGSLRRKLDNLRESLLQAQN